VYRAPDYVSESADIGNRPPALKPRKRDKSATIHALPKAEVRSAQSELSAACDAIYALTGSKTSALFQVARIASDVFVSVERGELNRDHASLELRRAIRDGQFDGEADDLDIENALEQAAKLGTKKFSDRMALGLELREDEVQPAWLPADTDFRTMNAGSVYHLKLVKSDAGEQVERIWLCSPIDVQAEVDTPDGPAWLISIKVHNGRNEITLPCNEGELRTANITHKLVGAGLKTSSARERHDLLLRLLKSARPQRRAKIAATTGWHGSDFVLPGGFEVIRNSTAGSA
jgi:hypothetical protein